MIRLVDVDIDIDIDIDIVAEEVDDAVGDVGRM